LSESIAKLKNELTTPSGHQERRLSIYERLHSEHREREKKQRDLSQTYYTNQLAQANQIK
jgi:hypothetical protein